MPQEYKPKSFWKKPEGITGAIFLIGALVAAGILLPQIIGGILALLTSTAGLIATLGVLGVLIFMGLDSKMRNLVSYMYKSTMRWITGIFVQIDPMGILKNYVSDLKDNLKKMRKQIGKIRAQMHKLKEMIVNNQKEIKWHLQIYQKLKTQRPILIWRFKKLKR